LGSTGEDITSLLCAAANGDAQAAEALWRGVYNELRRIAHARLCRERRAGELQTTIIVQEAFLRLTGKNGDTARLPANRRAFFTAAANAMRQFLVDHARKKGTLKRGAGRPVAPLTEPVAVRDCDLDEVLAVDEALTQLRRHDPRKAEVVQLRYFAGLSIDEVAEMLGISPRLVDQEWRFARAWLHRKLCPE